jgi:hypothetical protein
MASTSLSLNPVSLTPSRTHSLTHSLTFHRHNLAHTLTQTHTVLSMVQGTMNKRKMGAKIVRNAKSAKVTQKVMKAKKKTKAALAPR